MPPRLPCVRQTYDMANHGLSFSCAPLLAYLPLTDLFGGGGSEPNGVEDVTSLATHVAPGPAFKPNGHQMQGPSQDTPQTSLPITLVVVHVSLEQSDMSARHCLFSRCILHAWIK
jgi:hypothetical protein